MPSVYKRKVLRTLSGELLAEIRRRRVEKAQIRWPSKRYLEPEGILLFAREILGLRVYKRQREMLLAIQEHKQVAVRSGHRTAKSYSVAIATLWWYCTRSAARVVITAPTNKQVQEVIYREVRLLMQRSGVCLDCREAGITRAPCAHSSVITGTIGRRASTGIRSGDGREIWGFSAQKSGGAQGIAGKDLFLVIDEASEVDDDIFEAMHGNAAGAAHRLLTGNPTRLLGEFYDIFHNRGDSWHLMHISSLESPNCTGEMDIPGLATPEWCAERAKDWGTDSGQYKVRVLGDFATITEQRPFTPEVIVAAVQRHRVSSPLKGRLYLGLDPAGPTADGEGYGDSTGMAIRRGLRIITAVAHRGLTAREVVQTAAEMLKEHATRADEIPHLVLDASGPVGSRVADEAYNYLRENPKTFFITKVYASAAAVRDSRSYPRRRDECWATFARWVREGGAIPDNRDLAEELRTFRWVMDNQERAKALDKKQFLKELGRSPDIADACVLSCWQPQGGSWEDEQPVGEVTVGPDRFTPPWLRPAPEPSVSSYYQTPATRDWRG